VLIWGLRRSSFGIAIGALVAWINYVWLKQGVEVLARVAVEQESSPQPRVPARVYFRFAGRFVLMGLVVYVSVYHFGVPLLAIICGLLALGAAAIAEGIYEVLGSWSCTNT